MEGIRLPTGIMNKVWKESWTTVVSESGTRGLRRWEVIRNRKVPVDQPQVQQMLNEYMNHFNKVPENQFDAHPEIWDYQPPLTQDFA